LLQPLIGVAVLACAASSIAAESQWVHAGPDGKLVYKTTPRGDRIMDFSSAGYMGGGVALPNVPVVRNVKPSGGPDDTAAIQEAIDAVAAMPPKNGFRGAVLMAAGTYSCSRSIYLSAGGIVLRGSGATGPSASTITMAGAKHCAIIVGRSGGKNRRSGTPAADEQDNSTATSVADDYVPAGAMSFNVVDAAGLAVGDVIEIQRPVTQAWVHFMQMDDLVRNGSPQTWIRVGSRISTERTIVAISGKRIRLDIPLSDSFDSRYLNPPGAAVVKVKLAPLLSHAGVEQLHIRCPAMKISYSQHPYTALRINGQDCWARDLVIEETMNSVGIGGCRITLQHVTVDRTVPNVGGSKPAEFAPNGSQILLDRCSSYGDNIWHVATGGYQMGPIVLLNCTFHGNGHLEGHQRWTTGMLLDNCRVPQGGIDFKNRGSMGSGHGWALGWSVAWNCTAAAYVIQQPPGAMNWAIGCIGPNHAAPRPFDAKPMLSAGTFDEAETPVKPQSLYLAQLAERLGPQAVKSIGY
jgi:hypothetical protein